MPAIRALIQFIKNIFKYHKKKIFLAFISALVFLVFLFPYDDLSDFITGQVSKATDHQVFLSFDKIVFSFTPTPGLTLKSVNVETPFLPPMKIKEVSASPSLVKLLAFQLAVSLSLKGLWDGNLDFTGEFGKVEDVSYMPLMAAKFTNISLKEIATVLGQTLKTSIDVSGKLNGRVELSTTSFKEQPSGEVEVLVGDLRLPRSISTNIGPLTLPDIKFSELQVKARLVGGEVIIDEGTLGQRGEPISGKFKGKMSMNLDRFGTRTNIVFKEYELKMDFHIQKAIQSKLSLFLSFIDKFKKVTNDGSRYTLKISASKPSIVPQLDPVRKF